MSSTTLSGPVPVVLPSPPDPDYFTQTQWATYLALAEAALPAIVPVSQLNEKDTQLRLSDEEYEAAFQRMQEQLALPPTREQFDQFLGERITDHPDFLRVTHRMMGSLSSESRKRLGGALDLLASRIGAFLLTGTCIPLHQQPLHLREATLRKWRDSWFKVPRILHKTMSLMVKAVWSRTSPNFLTLSGYPVIPENWEPGWDYPFEFIQLPASKTDVPEVIETDVLIIGSGCGGGVVARHLAVDCGLGDKVLVVDKGYHFKTKHFPMNQEAGCELMFENGTVITSDDSSVSLAAGACWGGGGTINWSVMLELQDFVRNEWADQGLPGFASPEFQAAIDHVSKITGTGTDNIRHNPANRVVLDGSDRLGWKSKVAPQNTRGKEHYCGQCHMGCFSAEKQGPGQCWLADAAKAGAKCMEGFTVQKIIFEDDNAMERVVVGVVGSWVSRDSAGGVGTPLTERVTKKVQINAKRVVLSTGSLWSPVILNKSGLTNPHIGTNLHVHPCHHVAGIFPEDRRPWEGGIITSVCTSFEDLDGQGHGVKLETSTMIPYVIMSPMNWTSGLDVKLQALKYRQMSAFITLTRDRDSGRVFPDPITGRPRVDYTPSAYDRRHAMKGVEAAAKLCYVTGAQEIILLMAGVESFIRTKEEIEAYENKWAGDKMVDDPEEEDPRFRKWLERVRAFGDEPPFSSFLSAHQMGTCRMSATPETGVVDPEGRVWDTKGLYIADASVFPSASGVNPMSTVMAIAHSIAIGIGKEMQCEEK